MIRCWLSKVLSCLLVGLLIGCAVPRQAGFPDVARAVEQRTGHRIFWNQGGAADAAVQQAVRAMLAKELTLPEAVQIALLTNRALQAMYEDLMIAQADVVQAGLLRNPIFSFDVWFPRLEIGVEQDFLDILMIPAKKRVAAAEFEATKLRVGSEVIRLAYDVRADYYTLVGAQQVAAMRQTILAASEASVELAQRQHEAGNISDLDLVGERALYEQMRLDVANGATEILVARERLIRRMGLWGNDTNFTIAETLPDVPAEEPSLDHLESTAIAQRLDINAARQQAQAAAYRLAMAKNWRWIGGANLGAGLERERGGEIGAGPRAVLEFPIFDQKQATIARLEAEFRQSTQHLAAVSIDARSEVREARGRVLFIRSVVSHYRTTLIPLREQIVALSQQHYDSMLLGIYPLLLAKQNEVNTYREYIEAVRDYWTYRSELERAIGGRLTQSVPPNAHLGHPASPPATAPLKAPHP